MRIATGLLLIALLLAAVVPVHQEMGECTKAYPAEFRAYYIPSSNYLKMASLGQRNFFADLVFIWSVQFFDSYKSSVRDKYLFHTFQVITDLDPRFYEAYIFGDLFLSEDKRWDLLYRLADKGVAENPKNWIIAWDAGTYAFFQAKNYEEALKYFSTAYERDPKSSLLKDLLANAYKYRGDYRTSLRYWQAILRRHENGTLHQDRFFVMAARRNIFDLTIKIDLRRLNGALKTYKERTGRWPVTLGALASAGYISGIPIDPEGHPYGYDSRTGKVWCVTPFKFKGRFAKW